MLFKTRNIFKKVNGRRNMNIMFKNYFCTSNLFGDLIFLDSAHSLGETFVEIAAFWSILPSGSYIFGDDYDTFPGVKHDVDLFCSMYKLELQRSPSARIWGLRKP